jgi:CubicO group peptidase (beta-lactamase class C family)
MWIAIPLAGRYIGVGASRGAWDHKVPVNPGWAKASLVPGGTVAEGKVMYGFKLWLYAYGDGSKMRAWGGSGFGGQMPIALPEYDLLMVFTGWSVLPNQPKRGAKFAIDRVVPAVLDGPQPRRRSSG